MRIRVRCINYKLIWDRVTSWGSDVELSEDICLVCPACHSNAYKPVEKEQNKPETVVIVS